jgi:cytochrome c553
MRKSTRDIPTSAKKRPQKRGTAVVVRLQDDALARLDAFRAREKDKPSRPEMLRRFLEER